MSEFNQRRGAYFLTANKPDGKPGDELARSLQRFDARFIAGVMFPFGLVFRCRLFTWKHLVLNHPLSALAFLADRSVAVSWFGKVRLIRQFVGNIQDRL